MSSSIPQPKPSLQDLARLFLSLSGSREQWNAVAGTVFSATTVSSAGSLSGPSALVPVAAPFACSSASVPALGGDSPAGAAIGSAGRRERCRESSRSEWRRRRSSSGERFHLSKKRAGVGLLFLPPLLVWLASPPPLRPLL